MSEEEIKEHFINCIEGSYTLNLALSVLEDRERQKQENQQLKEQLQQREEVIKEAINYLQGCYEMSMYTKSVTLEKENVDDLLDILNKYKNKDKENNNE